MEKRNQRKESQEVAEGQATNTLRVSDLVPFTKTMFDEIKGSMKRLSDLTKEYYEMEDLFDVYGLESVKRRFNSELQYFTTKYSLVKRYKGDSHTYLSEQRKMFKAEAMELLIKDGFSQTAAEKMSYGSLYYKHRVELMQDLVEFFIKVEVLHDHYTMTLQAIIQSVSVAAKEKGNSYA